MNRSALQYGIAQKCHGGTIEIATIKARKLPNVRPVETMCGAHECEARIQNLALFGNLRRCRSARRAEQWDNQAAWVHQNSIQNASRPVNDRKRGGIDGTRALATRAW